jgi:FkbM family methyltransferase
MSEYRVMTNENIALVSVANMYLYYYRNDHAFSYALQDPRAFEVRDESQLKPLWTANDVEFDQVSPMVGMGIFNNTSIHYWQEDLDFDYIDVGANVGMTTFGRAIFFQRCGRNTRVYALEPGDVYSLLERSVAINRLGHVITCINAAANDKRGPITFHQTPSQTPAGSMLIEAVTRPGIVETNPTTVNAIMIDDLLPDLRLTRGLLIKIDAEGADFKVLDGMKKMLEDRLCTIQMEFFPGLSETYTDPLARLSELSKDYFIIEVGGAANTLLSTDRNELHKFISSIRLLPMPATDLFLVPRKLPNAAGLAHRIVER